MPNSTQGGAGSAAKRLLRAVLPERQYHALARLKNGSPAPDALVLLREEMEAGRVPPRSLVELKGAINVVERMDYARRDIFLNVDSTIEYDTRLNSCKKEPDTVEWIETFLKEGDVFYDIGANVGAYSLVAAKFFDDKVRVYAFEPAFLNFTQLCKNIHLNGCGASVTALSVALSAETSLGVFNHHSLVTGGALHTLGDAVDHKGEAFDPVFRQTVMSYRIDDLIEQFGVPAPDHIKIDVDGIEQDVLRGAAKTLASGHVRSVIVELEEGESERQITEFLAGKGFALLSKHTRWTPGMLNCIFERSAARA